MNKPNRHLIFVFGLFFVLVGIDQASKMAILHSLGDSVRDGILVSDHARRVAGDWLWLFIAYNPGSAFSLAPWKLVPFLSPTIFYTILTTLAFVFLWIYGKRHHETLLRVGAVCIAAGALGNLIDRWHLGHVIDFVSVGVPGVLWRWPTFNAADVTINVGVGIILFGDWVLARFAPRTAIPATIIPDPGTPVSSETKSEETSA